MTDAAPRDAVEELLALLRSGYEVEWRGGEVVNGCANAPWPDYHPAVRDGLAAAGRLLTSLDAPAPTARAGAGDYREGFRRFGHKPMTELDREEAATALTFVVRTERFVDGTIASWIEDGRLERLLARALRLADGARAPGAPPVDAAQ
ncbi:DUF6508 domain-containing protein [uncultured Propionibacterium sp.]|uniref:DUF6508 domain-containing protein n=1 Tax=uncultured Propionibacterium sp. TaxID=218066 RepID=UPI00292FBCB4|nr:DUF6508 domain-containing protein [uncultured Propionibacterium sp.]